MEFLQIAGPAIRDIGIIDLNEWGNGFENLYKKIWEVLFDKDRNLLSFWNPILLELKNESVVGSDRYTLASALARIAATYAFVNIAMDKRI